MARWWISNAISVSRPPGLNAGSGFTDDARCPQAIEVLNRDALLSCGVLRWLVFSLLPD